MAIDMDYILIRLPEKQRASLIFKANQIIQKLESIEDIPRISAEELLSRCALLNLEQGLDKFLKGFK